MTDFADYIVFVDESGDQSLSSIDPEFPVFCLSFCIVAKADYIGAVVPAVQVFKFKYWGHDAVILHEHEIRKTIGDFAFLRADRGLREAFMSDLSHLMSAAHRSAIFADRPRWVLEDFDRQHGAGMQHDQQECHRRRRGIEPHELLGNDHVRRT